jgi:hypothetical protein
VSDDLDHQLRAWRVPPASDEARARALTAATDALRQPPAPEPAPAVAPSLWPRWVALAGCAGLALAAIYHPETAPPGARAASAPSLAEAHVLAEMEALFPGQVNALITREDRIDLDLAAVPGRRSDQAILVEFTGHGETVRVLGYSGQSIRVPLKTRTLSFEPLTTTTGGVVLTADDFLWSDAQPASVDGYTITARVLPPAA